MLPNTISRLSQRLPTCVRSYGALANFKATNEPILQFLPGSQERKDVEAAVANFQSAQTDIPIVIGDEEIRTNQVKYQVSPFDHQKQIAKYHYADGNLIQKAIDVSLKARHDWERAPFEKRAEVFLKAADMIAKERRGEVLASTMLGQGKNLIQAEIDSGPELIDFLRFDVEYALELMKYQPISEGSIHNSMVYRGMEGFWAAVSPFNFTAIGGHLTSAPALMGNVVQWKPSDTAMLSSYTVYKIYREAGLPAGIINFLPSDGPVFGDAITASPDLAGINFTGSVRTFRHLWKQVANNLENYRSFPRLIGECGGKNFHFVHKSADVDSVVMGTIRSAFEYGGQKCSACSRAYIPQSMWPEVKQKLVNIQKEIKLGSALDADTFLSAVIDDKSFDRIKGYLNHAKSSDNLEIVAGGNCDDSKGYYVEPTIIETKDPQDTIMQQEIFGPVLTVYPYPDDEYKSVMNLVNTTSPFGLTGSVFAKDQAIIDEVHDTLIQAAGNFYINDKSTGSVVGQQPFGGARNSGTNDKAGGPHYLLRFLSPQAVKESKANLGDWKYPYMEG
ncbi:unnamed protein product [Owenia fusiformis]|uniref:Multifunctional fusion protein n=1 Tax=Owenia fusiformis TaxID=6347 RepID=A0A8J1YBD8_OWEFU|nr:unnamed protein product [Owenia fusiformis]